MGEHRRDRKVSQTNYTNVINAYVDHPSSHVQCSSFTLYNMVSNPKIELGFPWCLVPKLYYCTSKDNDALPFYGVPRFGQLRPNNFVKIDWFETPTVTPHLLQGLRRTTVFDRVGENPQSMHLSFENRPVARGKPYRFHIRANSWNPCLSREMSKL